jgi:histidinol dehydrogenase
MRDGRHGRSLTCDGRHGETAVRVPDILEVRRLGISGDRRGGDNVDERGNDRGDSGGDERGGSASEGGNGIDSLGGIASEGGNGIGADGGNDGSCGFSVPIDRIRKRYGGSGGAEDAAAAIIADVRERGDVALLEYAMRFDGASLSSLAATKEEIDAAFASLSESNPRLLDTMRRAADNIKDYHRRQLRQGFAVSERNGVVMGQRVMPIDRVGLYIPGGTAAYPSTLLMNAIPAKIAGVRELILATPPQKDGRAAAPILAAAAIAGVDRIFKVGGAQAIAAMAYGTQTVPRVDKITGPGNAYVTAAKRQVFGIVGIDMIAGPSEILIIADRSADAAFVASDMLAQAEHDAMAASILVTTDAALAQAVRAELAAQLPLLPRFDVAARSIADNGRIVVAETLADAAALSDAIAPEHLELCVEEPFALLGSIRHAGSVFLGHYAPEALGDYFAGPNHTLPTNGAARFSSPLSLDDFTKKSSYLYYSRDALREACGDVAGFARAEGLDAHARSAEIRFRENGEQGS